MGVVRTRQRVLAAKLPLFSDHQGSLPAPFQNTSSETFLSAANTALSHYSMCDSCSCCKMQGAAQVDYVTVQAQIMWCCVTAVVV